MNINFQLGENKELKNRLNTRLKEYGLRIMPTAENEMHGPHPQMEYLVYVLFIKEIDHPKNQYWVAVYPRAIYQIEDSCSWYKADPDSRLSKEGRRNTLTEKLKTKRGWLELGEGEWYLTRNAVQLEFKISEEDFTKFLHTWQGKRIRTKTVYTQLHTSKATCFFKLNDLRLPAHQIK